MKRLLSGTVHANIDMGPAGLSAARLADQAGMAVIGRDYTDAAGAGLSEDVAARGKTDKTDTKELCIVVVGRVDCIAVRY